MSINFTAVSYNYVPYVAKYSKKKHGVGMLLVNNFGVGDNSSGNAILICDIPLTYSRRYIMRIRSAYSSRSAPAISTSNVMQQLYVSYLLKGGATRIVDLSNEQNYYDSTQPAVPCVTSSTLSQDFCEQVGDIEAGGLVTFGAVWANVLSAAYQVQLTIDLIDDIAPASGSPVPE